MRIAWFLALVLAAGCTKNLDELRAAQAQLDRRLAERQEVADQLIQRRLELDRLELAVSRGLDEQSPEPRAQDEADGELPPSEPPVVVPPVSAFEGARAETARERLEDTQQRIAELDKVLGEMKNLAVRRRELEEELRRINKLRGARGPDAGP